MALWKLLSKAMSCYGTIWGCQLKCWLDHLYSSSMPQVLFDWLSEPYKQQYKLYKELCNGYNYWNFYSSKENWDRSLEIPQAIKATGEKIGFMPKLRSNEVGKYAKLLFNYGLNAHMPRNCAEDSGVFDVHRVDRSPLLTGVVWFSHHLLPLSRTRKKAKWNSPLTGYLAVSLPVIKLDLNEHRSIGSLRARSTDKTQDGNSKPQVNDEAMDYERFCHELARACKCRYA